MIMKTSFEASGALGFLNVFLKRSRGFETQRADVPFHCSQGFQQVLRNYLSVHATLGHIHNA